MALCLRASSRTSLDLITLCFATEDIISGKNIVLWAEKLSCATGAFIIRSTPSAKFFSAKRVVFATMTAEFWNKTVLGFRTVRELALRHKTERTGRWAEGLSRRAWCFYCFFLHQRNFRKLSYRVESSCQLVYSSTKPSPSPDRLRGLCAVRRGHGRGLPS